MKRRNWLCSRASLRPCHGSCRSSNCRNWLCNRASLRLPLDTPGDTKGRNWLCNRASLRPRRIRVLTGIWNCRNWLCNRASLRPKLTDSPSKKQVAIGSAIEPHFVHILTDCTSPVDVAIGSAIEPHFVISKRREDGKKSRNWLCNSCLLYTSPSPRDRQKSRMPASA